MFNISVVGNASFDPLQRAIATKILMEQANSSQNHPSHELGTRGTRQVGTANCGNKEECLGFTMCVCVS